VKDDGAIEWSRGATAIHNQVRGLFPWPHAYTFHGARRLIIWRTAVNASDARVGASALPGTIVAATGDDLLVRAGDAAVRVVELQTEGKRPMPVRQFLAGHALAVGSRLHRQ
jgi:methionyl-tRNA formyltransferase